MPRDLLQRFIEARGVFVAAESASGLGEFLALILELPTILFHCRPPPEQNESLIAPSKLSSRVLCRCVDVKIIAYNIETHEYFQILPNCATRVS
jgi:hypothetical protein